MRRLSVISFLLLLSLSSCTYPFELASDLYSWTAERVGRGVKRLRPEEPWLKPVTQENVKELEKLKTSGDFSRALEFRLLREQISIGELTAARDWVGRGGVILLREEGLSLLNNLLGGDLTAHGELGGDYLLEDHPVNRGILKLSYKKEGPFANFFLKKDPPLGEVLVRVWVPSPGGGGDERVKAPLVGSIPFGRGFIIYQGKLFSDEYEGRKWKANFERWARGKLALGK